MPRPTTPLPFLAMLIALAGAGGLGAAESGQQVPPGVQATPGDQARITAQAKDAGQRRLAASAALHPARATPGAATRSTSTTPLSIGTVSVATPANPAQVLRFTKLELVVPLTTGVADTNFYNPNPATGGITLVGTFTGPTATWVIPGYFDGTTWRIRFAADTIGAWSYVISAQDPSGPSTNAPQGSFTVVANPGSHGWVRVSGGHLAYSADATPFVGIGHNNGWLDDVQQPLISAMPGIGENVLSFWLCNPFNSANRGPIEASVGSGGAGIGIYNQGSCQTIDALFAAAEQAGVLLLPSIWSHNQLWNGTLPSSTPASLGSWPGNAYSEITDPTTSMPITPLQFYQIVNSSNVDTAQWTYQTNFYRYLIARWGYSTSLLGWVGVVEIDQTTGYNTSGGASLGEAWCQSVQGFFALNDPYRGSGAALGTVPVAFSKTDQDAGALTFAPSDPSFAVRIVDSYKSQTDAVGIATTIATETQILAANGTTPCFHSEFGAMVVQPDTLEPLHFHNALWAGISAGAALTPLKYCDGGDWPLITDPTLGPAYQATFSQLAAFLASVPYAGSAGVGGAQLSVSGLVQNVSGSTVSVNAWGQALSDRAFAWLQAVNTSQNNGTVSSGTLGNGTIAVAGLSSGTYQATWYDPWGTALTPGSVTTPMASAGTVSVAIPASPSGKSDLVLSLRRLPSASNLTVTVVAGTTTAITLIGSAGSDTISGAAITSLPVFGTLNQTNDGVTAGAAITTANTPVTTAAPAAPMVLYTAGGATGSDSFTYTVADGALISPAATVTVQIVPVNLPPTFTAGPLSISLNENALSYNYPGWASAISNGVGDTSALTGFTITTDQPGLFTTAPAINLSTGTLTFTTVANAFTSSTQPIHATVVLMDNGSSAGVGGGNASAPVTIAITINQVSLQPTLPAQSLSTFPSYPLAITLNGSVPDSATLTYALDLAHPPAHGTATIAQGPPAQVTYTAAAAYAGADTVGVLASDVVAAGANKGIGTLTTAATITLTVTANIPPLAYGQSVSVPENQALGIVLIGYDPDHQPNPVLGYTIASPPSHGTLSNAPPSVTYTPQADYVGADSFTFTTSDGLATSPPATVSIAVIATGNAGTPSSGGRCGSGNGFAALALLALTLGSGWRWRRPRR